MPLHFSGAAAADGRSTCPVNCFVSAPFEQTAVATQARYFETPEDAAEAASGRAEGSGAGYRHAPLPNTCPLLARACPVHRNCVIVRDPATCSTHTLWQQLRLSPACGAPPPPQYGSVFLYPLRRYGRGLLQLCSVDGNAQWWMRELLDVEDVSNLPKGEEGEQEGAGVEERGGGRAVFVETVRATVTLPADTGLPPFSGPAFGEPIPSDASNAAALQALLAIQALGEAVFCGRAPADAELRSAVEKVAAGCAGASGGLAAPVGIARLPPRTSGGDEAVSKSTALQGSSAPSAGGAASAGESGGGGLIETVAVSAAVAVSVLVTAGQTDSSLVSVVAASASAAAAASTSAADAADAAAAGATIARESGAGDGGGGAESVPPWPRGALVQFRFRLHTQRGGAEPSQLGFAAVEMGHGGAPCAARAEPRPVCYAKNAKLSWAGRAHRLAQLHRLPFISAPRSDGPDGELGGLCASPHPPLLSLPLTRRACGG